MAISLKVYPNLSPRIIEVESPTTDITLQEIVDNIRAWEDTVEGMNFPYLIDVAGKEDLGGGVLVGITSTLQNAQLLFTGRTNELTTGTITTADSEGLVLTDSLATFLSDSIYAGCTIFNATTTAMATVISVDLDTQITHFALTGGTRNDWQVGDSYLIYPNVQCSITGGNLVAVDDVGGSISPVLQSPNVQVVRSSSSSATLTEQTSIEHSSFNQGVTVDVTSSYSGTVFPVGTPLQPVNNISDAVSIADTRGFNTLYIIGNITLTTGHDVSDMLIIGQDQLLTSITVETGADVANCKFSNCYITGTLDGGNIIKNARVGTLNYVNGFIWQCLLEETITLGGATDATLMDCWSGVPGTGTPIINMGGSGQALGMRGYNGGIKITNKTGADATSIDMVSGHIILDSTVTQGSLSLRGVAKYTNSTTAQAGLDIDVSGLVAPVESQYAKKIYIDEVNGTAGTDYPLGLFDNPVDNMTDAKALAEKFNCTELNLLSAVTIPSGFSASYFQIEGNHNIVTLTSGCDTEHIFFTHCKITGTFNGGIEALHCKFTDVTNLKGSAKECFYDGTIDFQNGGTFKIINGRSETQTPPIFSVGTATVNCAEWFGMMNIKDKTGTEEFNIHTGYGYILVDSTCTAGSIYLAGQGEVINNSGGSTVDTSGMIFPKKQLTIAKFLGLK